MEGWTPTATPRLRVRERRIMRVPPPSACSATTSPPFDSATCRTIASPSPEPGVQQARTRRGRRGSRRSIGRSSSAMPAVHTDHRRVPSRRSTSTAPAGWAPLRGVLEQVVDVPLDRRRHAVDEGLVEFVRELDAGSVALRPLTTAAVTWSSRTSSGSRVCCPPARARSARRSASSSLRSLDDVRELPLPLFRGHVGRPRAPRCSCAGSSAASAARASRRPRAAAARAQTPPAPRASC